MLGKNFQNNMLDVEPDYIPNSKVLFQPRLDPNP